MPSTKSIRRRISGEELLRHPELGTCELINGEVIMLSPAGAGHGRVAMFIGGLIWSHVAKKRLGSVFAAETGFYLHRHPDTVRGPDCVFVSAERMPEEPLKGYLPFAPDLAVEVTDPADPPLTTIEKALSFVEAGVKLVWVVDYRAKRAQVYEQGKAPRLLPEDGILDGGRILPGFKLPLQKVWRAVEESTKKKRENSGVKTR